ncbi:hypothetical protein CRE_10339 [Caenorhabditis remanei]|uniref:RING-type domain-containing protein n=1 Tax=Caenorhabditis remanei TaxID=31234 RepID=E3MQF8_CAERE|nr:hypothetical protein CRE_10339 [Caenorhabditis remanei]
MHIKYAFDGSQLFDVYGSPQEFLDEMKIFQDFTQSHKYFTTNPTSTYYSTPFIYFNEKREKFVYKPDLFVILQYMMLLNVPISKNRIICSLSSILLKAYEDTLINASEFIRYDENEFEIIRNELLDTKRTFIDSDGQLQSDFYRKEILEKLETDFEKLSIDEVLEKLKKMVPFVLKEDEARSIHDWLEYERSNDKEWLKSLIVTYTNAGFVLKSLQAILKKRPDVFTFKKPKIPEENQENQEKSTENDEKSEKKEEKKPRLCCRVFQNGNQRFVLKDELYLALGQMCNCKKGRSLKSLCSELVQRIETIQLIPFQEVQKRYKERIEHIQFITVPLRRTKHRAVPIPAPDYGKFYVLGVDAVLEALNSLIWETRVFQKFPVKQKKTLYELFGDLDCLIRQQSDPYLVEHKRLQEIIAICDSKWDFHRKVPTNEVRKVSPDGFTVEDLIAELKYLEINTFFPNIANHAKTAWSEVNRAKRAEVLRTCDMYDALEICQLYCVFEHFPKIKNFFHAQKSCRRVPGTRCATCLDFWSVGVPSDEPTDLPWDKMSTETDSDSEDVTTLDLEALAKTTVEDSESKDSENSEDSEDSEESEVDDVTETASESSSEVVEFYTTATQTDSENLEKSLEFSEIEREKLEKKVFLIEKKVAEMKNSHAEIVERMRREMKKKQEENEKLKQKVTTFDAIQKSNEKFERKIGRIGIDLQEKQKEIMELRRELSTHTTTTRRNESKIDKLEKELKRIREKPTVSPLIAQENEELKMRISICESDEIRLHEAYAAMKNKFDEDRVAFSERISEMGRNLRIEKNKVTDLEQQVRAQNEDIAEKTHHLRLFHDSNCQLRMENEANKRTIQELMSRFSAPQQQNSTYSRGFGMNYEPPCPPPPIVIPRIAAIGSERAQRMASASASSLQNSPVPLLTPPPQPILEIRQNPQFMELMDSECLICLTEMMRDDETTIKCHECRRRFHFQCAAEWLKVKTICPTCKGKLLDPNEFPAL